MNPRSWIHPQKAKWAIALIAAMPLLFNCQSPVTPPAIASDPSEFVSVWQYCRAWSIYQDSSLYTGSIPSGPFVCATPAQTMKAIEDTLHGVNYTRYNIGTTAITGVAHAAVATPLTFPISVVHDGQTIEIDSLSDSTIRIWVRTFEASVDGYLVPGQVYADIVSYLHTISRFRKIIIDLRQNLGGFIDDADSLIELMVPQGTPYIQARQRDYDYASGKYVTRPWHPWTTSLQPRLAGRQVAVLMDGSSASASELTIAGLYEGASGPGPGGHTLIVGTTSYGKGIGQIQIDRRDRYTLSQNGDTLKYQYLNLQITFLQLKGVSDRIGNYHRHGIVPDTIPDSIKAIVDGRYAENDPQRQVAYALLMLEPSVDLSTMPTLPVLKALAPAREPMMAKVVAEDQVPGPGK